MKIHTRVGVVFSAIRAPPRPDELFVGPYWDTPIRTIIKQDRSSNQETILTMELIMKRLITLLTFCTFAFSAFGVSQHISSSDTASMTATATVTPSTQGGVSALQLAVGTLKLDGTSEAVTTSQAVTLLPLWTTLKSLESQGQPQGSPQQGQGNPSQGNQSNPTQGNQGNSQNSQRGNVQANNTAIDAQIKLIGAAMTSAQLQSIASMQISQATLQGLGIQGMPPITGTPGTPPVIGTLASPPSFGTIQPGMLPTLGTLPAGTSPAGGVPPGKGNGGAPGQGKGPGQGPAPVGTPQGAPPTGGSGNAGNSQGSGQGVAPQNGMRQGDNFIPTQLIDAVVQYLQKKAGS